MTRLHHSLIAFLLLLTISLIVFALEVPPLNGQRIVDTATLLTAQDRTNLDHLLSDFEAKTGNQIAVLIIPTLAGENLESFSNKAFRSYKLGQKDKNNGALLVIAHNDHKLRIEVGYGLEALLTDGRTGQIMREQITPQFKQNNYIGGINAGLREMMHIIDAKYQPPTASLNNVLQPTSSFPIVPVALGGVATLIIGGIAFKYLRNKRRKRNKAAAKSTKAQRSTKASKNAQSNEEAAPRKNAPNHATSPKDSSGHKQKAKPQKDKPSKNSFAKQQHNKANKNTKPTQNTKPTYTSSYYDNSSSYSSSSSSETSYSSSSDSSSYSSDSSSFSGGGGDSGGGGASSDW